MQSKSLELLPTAQKLAKLPLRAIAAYAARAARRAKAQLRNLEEDNIIEEALAVAENAASIEHIDSSEAKITAIDAAKQMSDVIISLTGNKQIAALAIRRAANTAYLVLRGILYEKNKTLHHAARSAEYTASSSVLAFDEPMATVAAKAARRDYEIEIMRYC